MISNMKRLMIGKFVVTALMMNTVCGVKVRSIPFIQWHTCPIPAILKIPRRLPTGCFLRMTAPTSGSSAVTPPTSVKQLFLFPMMAESPMPTL